MLQFPLCCILWFVTSLNLSRISSFKRSRDLLTGVSTCLKDLSIPLKAVNKIIEKPNLFFTILSLFQILVDTVWALSYLTDGGNDQVSDVIKKSPSQKLRQDNLECWVHRDRTRASTLCFF
jgi:hypothetical protein